MNPDLERQIFLIYQLKSKHSLEIELFEKSPSDINKQYNCFMHAFNIHNSEIVIELLKSFAHAVEDERLKEGLKIERFMVDDNFVNHLLDNDILHPANDENGIIIYFDDEKRKNDRHIATHGGKKQNQLVISKWGIGHLWKHSVWEVPDTFGHNFKIFQDIPNIVAEEEFINYSRGILKDNAYKGFINRHTLLRKQWVGRL